MTQAEDDQQERKRNAFLKSEDENQKKQDKKIQGRQALTLWETERKKQIAQRKTTNKQQEEDYNNENKRLKTTTNPWERIVSQVEINQAGYVGQCDVSRIRQAMIARKGDLTQGGQSKKQMF